MFPEENNGLSFDLVEILRGIVLLLDSEGRIAQCNPYFEELTGYSSAEVAGEDWFDTFIPENERNTIREFFYAVREEGLNDGYTNPILTKTGDLRLIEWHSKTLHRPDGRFVGMLCTGFDVSERTATALALQEAKELAESATMAKTRFLAAASHDLRQPLQSLRFYLAALSRGQNESTRDELTRKMSQSLDIMGELLNSLLDISKLDSGSITPEKHDFHLQDLLDRVVADNVQQAEEKGLQLVCARVDSVVHSDPALLERVIENLVTNAIRYTDRGRVAIECEHSADTIGISVSDTGVGISEDEIDNVFQEYYQLDNPIRDRRKGLGLGLSIVKHIGALLDHPLAVSSIPGKGSIFSVEVPLGEQVAQTSSEQAEGPLSSDRDRVVLLVDDDPAVLDSTAMLLTLEGIQAHTALNGEEALAHIASGLRPDIVVSDYRLPNYNGVEVVRRVREATVDDLPVVLMTGDTSAKEIEDAALTNCAVLNKPVDADQLIPLIFQLTE